MRFETSCFWFNAFTTYIYRRDNPVTKYHGHPSTGYQYILPSKQDPLLLNIAPNRVGWTPFLGYAVFKDLGSQHLHTMRLKFSKRAGFSDPSFLPESTARHPKVHARPRSIMGCRFGPPKQHPGNQYGTNLQPRMKYSGRPGQPLGMPWLTFPTSDYSTWWSLKTNHEIP